MTKRKRIALATGASLLTLALIGGVALADDGGVMQRMMGNDAYVAMVEQMRAVLGNERADQMVADCEKMMASSTADMPASNGMMGMMSGMGSMMRGR